jgi:hypothetical protein
MRRLLAILLFLAAAGPLHAEPIALPPLNGEWSVDGGCEMDGYFTFENNVLMIHDDLESAPRPYRRHGDRLVFADGEEWRILWAGRASFEVMVNGRREWIVRCRDERAVAEGE